jgi:uncharacterized protein (TIGR02646 family)
MRYIQLLETNGPIKNNALDQDWLDKAANLTSLLAAAPDKASRDAIINDQANQIWGEIKDWLLSLSHNKCWFSEAEDVFSHRDVEHFRPKSACQRKVGQKRNTHEDGYWWLTYDWKNYRICGNVGNRKKGIMFPLLQNSQVASYGSTSYLNECPIFLDPTSPADPPLLDFIETGKAVPHQDADAIDNIRVTTTVKHLRLDFEKLEEARAKVWIKCRRLIQECRDLTASGQPGPAEITQIQEKRKQLREMVDPKAPFSMTAAACLRKSGIGWAATIASGA